ncbi:MAG: peptide chain release factor 1 [Alphaproteobacteria bacterium]|nr:peptide chain release factor 1 [Alphaproteobacteria bacterium]
MSINDKLDRVVERHKELAETLAGEIRVDPKLFAKYSKEYSDLSPVVEAIIALRAAEKECTDLEGLLADLQDDPEMKSIAEVEKNELRIRIRELEHNIKVLLLPKDEIDERNAIIEIRAGTGGDEAGLFAADLLRMYERYAEHHGWKFELLQLSESGIGAVKEVSATITGRGVFARLKFESGVHRVQRVPTTETSGRIHTSAATVAVLPEAEEVDVKIEDKDLRIDVFRSSGPGGQSVNTTDSAVRVTHIPTGIVVQQQDEKSQHKNKAKALKILRARLFEAQRMKIAAERSAQRKSQIGTGDRSERIRTYNFPQGRVSDHRINLTLYKIVEILNGEALDELIDALLADDQANRLAELDEMPPLKSRQHGLTIQASLEWGAAQLKKAEINDSSREARLLMSMILDMPFEYILSHLTNTLSMQDFEVYAKAIKRRLLHEPLSKIVGKREFWSLSFQISHDTLDPRPDSETIIEAVLDCILDRSANLRILDLGTGSGCLLLALLHELPNSYGIGIDKSELAVSIAQANARTLGLESRANFLVSDWAQAIQGTFDFVVSNPPYLSEADMKILAPNVSLYDPHLALKGGYDGLVAYRRLAQQLGKLLKMKGLAMLEIGEGQEAQVKQIMQKSGLVILGKRTDLAGRARCVVVHRS